jgi:hypothetical protein
MRVSDHYDPNGSPGMPRRTAVRRALALAALLSGCGARRDSQADMATAPPAIATLPPLEPTAPPELAPPLPTSAPDQAPSDPSDTGWLAGEPGLELRRLSIDPGGSNVPLVIVRFDPAQLALHVIYDPDAPRPMRAWAAIEPSALLFNGGYFTETYRTTSLLISGGVASGDSYEGFGGMLAVDTAGQVSLRPLRDQAYDPSESIVEAVQSFPMLVLPGGAEANFEDNGQRARRTAVAIDRSGRLLVIAAPTSGLALHDLAGWLRTSDLEIDRALNLDGGPSTAMFVQSGDLREQIDSFGSLPIVIAVRPTA